MLPETTGVAIEVRRRLLGHSHPDTLASLQKYLEVKARLRIGELLSPADR